MLLARIYSRIIGQNLFHDIGWAEGVQKVVEEYIKPIQLEEHILDNTYWARIKKWKN